MQVDPHTGYHRSSANRVSYKSTNRKPALFAAYLRNSFWKTSKANYRAIKLKKRSNHHGANTGSPDAGPAQTTDIAVSWVTKLFRRTCLEQVRMLKNPETGKRISRPNPESEWHRATVPTLRIISDEMFKTATSIRRGRSALAPVLRRNPKRILSGLLRCATCEGGMSIKGTDRGGTRVICTRFHNAGLCANNRTYYLHHIEDLVLSGLRKHLVDPKAIQHFLRCYQEERKRLCSNRQTASDLR